MMNEAQTVERLRRLVAAQLQASEDEITEQTGIGLHPKWDSMAHVSIILAIEQEFGVQADEALMNCQDIRALAARLG